MPAGVSTVPAPIGGINAYDSIAGMAETDALALINWYPQVYGCYLRRGRRVHQPALGSDFRTIVSWSKSSGTNALYGIAGGKLYDITNPESVGSPTELLTGLSTNYWQSVNFSNSAGPHLVLVSGQDQPIWLHYVGGVLT